MKKHTFIKDVFPLTPGARRVFEYIRDFGSITTKQAIDDLGETRLSARIFELREKGIVIDDKYIAVKNRYGEHCHVKRYWFA